MRVRTRASRVAKSVRRSGGGVSGTVLEEVRYVHVIEKYPPRRRAGGRGLLARRGTTGRPLGQLHPLRLGRLVCRGAAVEPSRDAGDPELVSERVVAGRSQEETPF